MKSKSPIGIFLAAAAALATNTIIPHNSIAGEKHGNFPKLEALVEMGYMDKWEKFDNQYYSVTTDYFWTKSLITKYPGIYLPNNGPENIINNIAPISHANPYYSPKGKHLYSVSTLKNTDISDIKKELSRLFPKVNFNFIKRYYIKKALPKSKEIQSDGNVLECGDHLETPSINGALLSGRKMAEKIRQKIMH